MLAKISHVKARFSAYVARARDGETVIVCDRQTPVARLMPLGGHEATLRIRQPTPQGKRALRALRSLRLKPGLEVVRLLREDRDQR